jgi:hypothetical protein
MQELREIGPKQVCKGQVSLKQDSTIQKKSNLEEDNITPKQGF